jgi:hypothetical protein
VQLQAITNEGFYDILCTWWVLNVVDLGVHSKWRGAEQGHKPQKHNDAQGDPRAGRGVRVDRMADGEVALRGERHDREN